MRKKKNHHTDDYDRRFMYRNQLYRRNHCIMATITDLS